MTTMQPQQLTEEIVLTYASRHYLGAHRGDRGQQALVGALRLVIRAHGLSAGYLRARMGQLDALCAQADAAQADITKPQEHWSMPPDPRIPHRPDREATEGIRTALEETAARVESPHERQILRDCILVLCEEQLEESLVAAALRAS